MAEAFESVIILMPAPRDSIELLFLCDCDAFDSSLSKGLATIISAIKNKTNNKIPQAKI
jgi:hypothetical protein